MSALEPYLLYIKLIGIAALMTATWWLTADHYEGVMAKQLLEQAEAGAMLIADRDESIKQGDIQHGKDQKILGNLNSDLDAAKLRDKQTITCDTTSESSPDRNRAGRVANTRIDDYIAISPDNKAKIVATYKRCAQLNIDAIRSNTANR